LLFIFFRVQTRLHSISPAVFNQQDFSTSNLRNLTKIHLVTIPKFITNATFVYRHRNRQHGQ
jgi:hypothetical protein